MVRPGLSDNGANDGTSAADLHARLRQQLRDGGSGGTATSVSASDEAPEQVDVINDASASIEELRLIQRLFFLNGSKGPRTVVFCGVDSDDGASHMCARSGELLAALTKQPVCLIGDQMSLPLLPARYQGSSAARLSAANDDYWKDEIRYVAGYPFLSVLPTDVLKAKRPIMLPAEVSPCLGALKEQFGYIVISAPPVRQSAEAILLGQMTNGVVMVIKAHSTSRTLAVRARKSMDEHYVPLLGAILNRCEPERLSSSPWNLLRRNSNSRF